MTMTMTAQRKDASSGSACGLDRGLVGLKPQARRAQSREFENQAARKSGGSGHITTTNMRSGSWEIRGLRAKERGRWRGRGRRRRRRRRMGSIRKKLKKGGDGPEAKAGEFGGALATQLSGKDEKGKQKKNKEDKR
mmetsp:Transcript_31095/g.66888  ORF Transcript_31095/g.66888 Transcript_31095/m.66888 type:complete len:136 (+) Transcript_31095:173-580(+)